MFEDLANQSVQSLQFIDSSIVRAQQHAAGGKKGGPDNAIDRSSVGLSKRIHAVVDEQGLPVKLALKQGHASDKAIATEFVMALPVAKACVGDRGCGAITFVNPVRERGGCTHIPTHRGRKV